jgi:PKD repeat protein
MKKLITILFIVLSVKLYPQCATTVSPASASVDCTSGASPVSFTATFGNPTVSVVHEWWSPYNPMPQGAPMYTAGTITSVLNASLAPGIYTVISRDLVNFCTDTVTFIVTSSFAFPSFSMTSPTNYSLGCAPLNQSTLMMVNSVSTQTPPATCSFTFLAPTFTGVVTPSIVLGPNTSTTPTFPGIWTAIVQDNSNFCRNILPIMVVQNTVAPNVSASMSTQTLTCNTPTILATGSSTTPNASISWLLPVAPPNYTQASLVVGGPPTGPNTATTSLSYASFTVIATDTANACQSASVVTIMQNFKPPVSSPSISIGTPTSLSCGSPSPVVLTTGGSTVTSGQPGAFPIVYLWGGPPPQTTVSGSSTYSCYVAGQYSLIIQDSYNGCLKTGTVNVIGGGTLSASFSHTVGGGGVVNFSNTTVPPGTVMTTNWNFGDGNLGSGNSLSHTFASAGAFPVTMSVATTGCTGTVVQSVNVTGIPCIADASFTLAPTYTPQYWTATPNYPWNTVAAEWIWGDGSTSNTLYSSHTYNSPGTYSICLTVTASCGSTATACINQYVNKMAQENNMVFIQVVAPMLISVKESEMTESIYSIYPNPGAGEFNIGISSGGEKFTVKVFDALGNLVTEKDYDNKGAGLKADVDLRTSPSGIYFVRISDGQKEYVKKIIINH